jgi:mono/diheme cytochrome c family protein
MRWAVVLALGALAMSARAQAPKAPGARVVDPAPDAGPSTLSGVYTEAQAARGKDVYAGNCRSCHTPMSHTGAMFATWWHGKQLSDLFTFVSTQMPKNDPGSLSPEDAADVVAYLLQMNAMPPGKAELYPDADSLKKFRIETRRDSSRARTP